MFASLHNHCYASNIRFLDSINKPDEMVAKAISLGFSGMAFTDHESLSAAVSILKLRDVVSKEHPDFKFIFGNEIYLIDQKEFHQAKKYYHFILLAKDRTGWDQLRELSSRAWERGYVEKGLMRVPTSYQDIEDVVGRNPGHLFASTACLGGELPSKILEHDVSGANAFVKWCLKVFGADFVLELQPSDREEQQTVNKVLVKFSRHYNVPYIITTDSHYLDKGDFSIHSAFLNSRQSSDRETDKFYRFTYIMSEDEMRGFLLQDGLSEEEIKEGFANTCLVADKCENYDFRHSTIVPRINLPAFSPSKKLYLLGSGYPAIKKFYESSDKQDSYLMYQIERGIESKGIKIDSSKLERINTELDVLDYIGEQIHQKLSAYLNLTKNIVDIAWAVSLVGVARGSAAGFYINYLIGITQADPLRYNLPYWRFLNKERVELPDVDEDFQPEKTDEIIALLRKEYGEDHVLNCATFKTESLKSSILTAGRGLGFNNDDMQAIAATVPVHRGITYSLDECLEGDEEKGFEPVNGFKEKFAPYPGLLEAVRKIEDLPSNASIHASALYVFNDGYLAQNSLMRAPSGTKMTAFDMHDSDDMGALKMDLLRTDAESKIAKCLDLLLKNKEIEWQGSLRATYDKYIHPDVLNYDDKEMWRKADDGEITNLFQMETMVGSVCMKKARPSNVGELAEINSIMRLQSESGEQPIDRYVRFREDREAWHSEMLESGLTEHEVGILRKYLDKSCGVSGSQETLMQILMDPEVCNFTLGEANSARKAIAKKISAKLIQLKKDFYEKGDNAKENIAVTDPVPNREKFLDYVWKYCIEPQLGYSFSLNHTTPYSLIALQEMNLATRWNPLYWQCACLCVNSGNYVGEITGEAETDVIETVVTTGEEEKESSDEENEEETLTGETVKKERHVAPNYGKISRAITNAQLSGVSVELPDINQSQTDFVPDIENNSILYSLQAINVVSDDLLNRIMSNRPYSSVSDFIERVSPTQGQMIGLIKSGCFDRLCGKSRRIIMNEYLQMLADKACPPVEKMTYIQLKKLLNLGYKFSGYPTETRLFNYKKYLDKNELDKTNKRYILKNPACIDFFHLFLEDSLNLTNSDYEYLPGGKISMKVSVFKKFFDGAMKKLMFFLNTNEGKAIYQNYVKNCFVDGLLKNYCSGSVSKWEMDTMCFYHSGHELKNMNNVYYNTKNFDTLPENSDGRKNFCTIAGTVTETNNMRHMITLLTNYGMVDVKFYADVYTRFNQKISVIDPTTKKKTVMDDTWFKRGNKLLIHGQRRENLFYCKGDFSQGRAPLFVGMIDGIREDGTLEVHYGRKSKE